MQNVERAGAFCAPYSHDFHDFWLCNSACVSVLWCLQAIRMLAAVIAKNAVGSSWRKTLGTREWSRVPDEEKHMVKEATMSLMLSGVGGVRQV